MNLFKDYKGVAIMYLVLTIFSVFFVVNVKSPNNMKQVKNEVKVVKNY